MIWFHNVEEPAKIGETRMRYRDGGMRLMIWNGREWVRCYR